MDIGNAAVEFFELGAKNPYSIGEDVEHCDSPHFHLHFIKNGVEKKHTDYFRKKYKEMFTNKDKIYRAKDIKDSNPLVWYAYAIKEKNVIMRGFSTEDYVQVEALAAGQKEVKRLKRMHMIKIDAKKDIARSEKDKLFEYIDARIEEEKGAWSTISEWCSHQKIFQILLYIVDYNIEFEIFNRSKYNNESYAINYLVSKKLLTSFDVVRYQFSNLKPMN